MTTTTAAALPDLNLRALLRFISSHDLGQRTTPKIEGDHVVFECSYTQRAADGTISIGYEFDTAKTLREARAKLGY